ncbi:MAG: RNase P modulator RnpM [Candidatus Limnocylindrales bacterium]
MPRPDPARTCVACRTTRPKRDLVRIVRTAEGRVIEDHSGRLAGRGAYVCADGSCREQALTKGALSRALSVSIPAGDRALLMTGGDNRG